MGGGQSRGPNPSHSRGPSGGPQGGYSADRPSRPYGPRPAPSRGPSGQLRKDTRDPRDRGLGFSGGQGPSATDWAGDGYGNEVRRRAGEREVFIAKDMRVVFEDSEIIIVDKPHGIVTAAMVGDSVDSVFQFVKDYVKDKARKRGTRVWILHRLDKEASGLLVFAKTLAAFENLKEQLRTRRMHRLYAAVVEGELSLEGSMASTSSRIKQLPSGVLQSFLSEGPDGIVRSVRSATAAPRNAPKKRATSQEDTDDEDQEEERGGDSKPDLLTPKLAVTNWRYIAAGIGRTLVQLKLDSGRKNQIRVHMNDWGRPIVGDRRYGAVTDPIDRVCLHAMELAFAHPKSGQMVRFRSAVPRKFLQLIGKTEEELGPAFSAVVTSSGPTASDSAIAAVAAAASTAVPSDQSNTVKSKVRAEAVPTGAPQSEPPTGPADGTTSWDHVADWYQDLLTERTSDHHERVVMPGTTRLLAAKPGERLLDVACGEGVFARHMGKLGVNVLGVDAAPKLIEHAKQSAEKDHRCAFAVGDARELAAVLGNEPPFDRACCVLALMNIDPLTPVMRSVASALVPGGTFVGVILHPAFRAPGQTSWGWEELAANPTASTHRSSAPRASAFKQYRRVDGYLSPGTKPIVMNPGAAAKGKKPVTTTTFHRPIQTYVQSLTDAGFAITALEEWASARQSEPGPRAAEENRIRKEIPMFLAFRAVKLG